VWKVIILGRTVLSSSVTVLFFAVLLTAACNKIKTVTNKGSDAMEITVRSASFEEGGMILARYTCDGLDVSPPLSWGDPPDSTESFALIGDDPDAPMGTWVHWVMFNIPPDARGLPENIPSSPTLSDGSVQGITDFGTVGYGGPCPPSGTHRYFFKLYALDTKLDLPQGASKKDVESAMKGHIIASGQIMGTYRRQR